MWQLRGSPEFIEIRLQRLQPFDDHGRGIRRGPGRSGRHPAPKLVTHRHQIDRSRIVGSSQVGGKKTGVARRQPSIPYGIHRVAIRHGIHEWRPHEVLVIRHRLGREISPVEFFALCLEFRPDSRPLSAAHFVLVLTIKPPAERQHAKQTTGQHQQLEQGPDNDTKCIGRSLRMVARFHQSLGGKQSRRKLARRKIGAEMRSAASGATRSAPSIVNPVGSRPCPTAGLSRGGLALDWPRDLRHLARHPAAEGLGR